MVTAVTVTVCKTFSIVFLGTFQINAYLCRRQISKEPIMCTYKDIDLIVLPNGQTVSEANHAASREVERIYADSWRRGVSVPFFDNDGNTYLANPDGSEDRVALDRRSRTYRILSRTAAPGKGRYSYLISRR